MKMKQSIFRTELSSKAITLIKKIIKAECMNVKIEIKDNAIGDTVITVKGSTAEIKVLRSIFEMVA